MITKPLIRLLKRLHEQGEIPASYMSQSHRQALNALFETDVLAEIRKGRGCSIRVNYQDAFVAFITKHYPEGLSAIGTGMISRTEGVAGFRDSKQGRLTSEIVTVSARAGQKLERHGQSLCVGELTSLAQVASFLLVEDDQAYWQFTGCVALVENHACFAQWQHMGVNADMALLTSGRISERVIHWLKSPAMQGCVFLHCGDYDPVGLDEYLRLKQQLPEDRVMLYIPHGIEALFQRYANPTLLANKNAAALLKRLRASKDPDVNRIVHLMNQTNGALEQEILLPR